MAETDRIVFPDEIEEARAEAIAAKSVEIYNSNRIVYPDEVEDVKWSAANSAQDRTSGGDTNNLDNAKK